MIALRGELIVPNNIGAIKGKEYINAQTYITS